MSIIISDLVNKLILEKDEDTKIIKILFNENDKGIVINNYMWACFDNNKIEGENWDIDNEKCNLDNYQNLTDIDILGKIKNRLNKGKLDDKFKNLLLVLRHYSF